MVRCTILHVEKRYILQSVIYTISQIVLCAFCAKILGVYITSLVGKVTRITEIETCMKDLAVQRPPFEPPIL